MNNIIYIKENIEVTDDKAVHTGYYAQHDAKSDRYFGWSGGIIGKGNQPKVWKTLKGVNGYLKANYPDYKVIVK